VKKDYGSSQLYANLYQVIADDDLTCHFQDNVSLEAKADFDFRQISKLINEGVFPRVLEIGPGKGHLAAKLMLISDYYSMDIVPNYLLELPGKKFLGNIEKAPESLYQVFNLVIVCDVLEHVLNEGNAWEELNNLLTENGVLYLRVPNREPLVHYSRISGTQYPFVHLRSYSKQTIKMNSYAHNFYPKKIRTVNFGKYSFARRNFGLRKLYRLNASSLRSQLKPGNTMMTTKRSFFIDTSARILSHNQKIRNRIDVIYKKVFFRGTEIYGILIKKRSCS
jgi:SAM-dependent methyltransferase